MAEILTGISPQPEFPSEDLTEDNAAMLELMLSNLELVSQAHASAKSASLLFRIAHPAIVTSGSKLYDDNAKLAAINHGVATFEAMTALVGVDISEFSFSQTDKQISHLIKLEKSNLTDYFTDSVDGFRSETPRAAEVIRAGSERLHGYLTTFAILGAAISRQLEIEAA